MLTNFHTNASENLAINQQQKRQHQRDAVKLIKHRPAAFYEKYYDSGQVLPNRNGRNQRRERYRNVQEHAVHSVPANDTTCRLNASIETATYFRSNKLAQR